MEKIVAADANLCASKYGGPIFIVEKSKQYKH